MNNEFTFDVKAEVDGKDFGFQITVPGDKVPDIDRSLAHAIILLLQPRARSIKVESCSCLY